MPIIATQTATLHVMDHEAGANLKNGDSKYVT